MKNSILYILTLLITILILSFELKNEDKEKESIVGRYYRYTGTDNAEIIFDSLNNFKYYHWCDICPKSEISGKWRNVDSLVILTDTILYSFNAERSDTVTEKRNRIDTLYFRQINNQIFLCHKLPEKFIQKLDADKRWIFGCYKKEYHQKPAFDGSNNINNFNK
jgi:hypothetical protein